MDKQKRYSIERERGTNHYRITALIDMPEHGVRKGQVGGLIESDFNLPQGGTGWIDKTSSVFGKSQVKKGLISKSSTLSGNVVIDSGEIESSLIKGSVKVVGHTIIKGSSLKFQSNDMTDGVVENSIIENLQIEGVFQITNSKIRARRMMVVEKSILATNAEIHVEYGRTQSLYMKDSILRTKSIAATEDFNVENVYILAKKSLAIGEWFDLEEDSKTVIKGTAGAPVKVKGWNLKLFSTTITGSAELTFDGEGDISISYSTISDVSRIQMKKGSINNCTISEMATVYQLTNDYEILKDIVLSGEEKYEY